MLTMQPQPAREVAFDYGCVAVRNVVAAGHIKMSTGTQRELGAALEAAEVQAPGTTAARRERTIEAVTDPQLVTGRAAKEPDVRCDALLDLHTLLQDAIFVADEAAAENRRLQEFRRLQREESGIGVFEPLRMCRLYARQSAQNQRECDHHANAGN